MQHYTGESMRILLILAMLVLPMQAYAGSLCFTTAGANTAIATIDSADFTNVPGGANHYWVAALDPTVEERYVYHFFYPPDNPGNFTAVLHWTKPSGVDVTNVVFTIAGGCARDGVNVDTIALGTPAIIIDTALAGATLLNTTAATPTFVLTNHQALAYCELEIRRDATNGSDTLPVDAQVVGVCVSW